MVRVDKRTNIFNLIDKEDSTVEDFEKLYSIAPEKFDMKKNGMDILEYSYIHARKDLYEYFKTIKKKIVGEREIIEAIKYSSPEKFQDLINDTNLGTLTKGTQETIVKTLFDLNYVGLVERLNKLYILFNNPSGGIDINIDYIKSQGYGFTESYPAFFEFAKSNDIEILKKIIEKFHPNLEQTDSQGYTILIIAINSKNYDAAKIILDNGLNINRKINDTSYFRFLPQYIRENDNLLKFIKLFLEKGLNVDAPLNSENYSYLMLSIRDNNIKLSEFLLDHGANPNHISNNFDSPFAEAILNKNIEMIKKLIEKGVNVNIPIGDKKIGALYIVISLKLPLNIIKLLLDSGANKEYKDLDKNKTPLEVAQEKYETDKEYYGKVIELLGGTVPKKELWKGFSRSDIEKFDIFFEKPFDWSCCPICLEYVERSDGCMYMSHDCAKTKHYYHNKLYDKFAYETYQGSPKKVEWCTVCGRITENHKHYKLSVAEEPSKEKAVLNPEIQARLDRGDNFAFFDNANCIGFGGGGTEEKTARFRRLREYALELQEEVDKKEQDDILQELVEEVWNAPLIRNRKIKKILEDKKWNINVKEFPENKKNNTAKNNANAANLAFNGTKPTIVDGDCIILAEDDNKNTRETNPKFHFHHETVGGIDHNGIYICQKDLAKAIEIKCAEFGLEDFGKCWWSQCKGVLHPEELKGIIPEVLYNDYRKKFNKKMAQKGGTRKDKRKTRKVKKQRGGNTQSVLYELSDGTCTPHNWTRDGKLRKI